MRLTVGPLPPAVYWRRRGFVLGGVLLTLFLLAQACMSASAAPEGAESTGGPTGVPSSPAAAPSTSVPAVTTATTAPVPPTAGATPTPSPADPAACTDEEMRIVAEADRASFTSGTTVRFTIRIRNDSDRTCRRDIGGDQRELYLRQGPGEASKVWSSRDCGAPTGRAVTELAADFETAHWVEWSGLSSEACASGRPAGEPLPPGEYELVARLGTAYSDPLVITVR